MIKRASPSIIIRQMDFKESDKIITFLTSDDGVVSGVVRGVKKLKSRYGTQFEPLSHLVIEYVPHKSDGLASIRGAELKNSFVGIRQNYSKILYGSYFSELVSLCSIPKEESVVFFDLLQHTLEALETTQTPQALKLHFELQLLGNLGLRPSLETCQTCQQALWQQNQLRSSALHGWDLEQGGLLCPACEPQAQQTATLSPGTLRYWQQTIHPPEGTVAQITRFGLQEWNRAFLRFFQYHVGRFPRSYELLKNSL